MNAEELPGGWARGALEFAGDGQTLRLETMVAPDGRVIVPGVTHSPTPETIAMRVYVDTLVRHMDYRHANLLRRQFSHGLFGVRGGWVITTPEQFEDELFTPDGGLCLAGDGVGPVAIRHWRAAVRSLRGAAATGQDAVAIDELVATIDALRQSVAELQQQIATVERIAHRLARPTVPEESSRD